MEASATSPIRADGVWENGEDPAASEGDPILRVEGIDASYGKVQILHDVSMVVHPGEAVSIIGPNGAGKSTVLKSVIGQLKPSTGKIVFNGTDVVGMRPEQVVRHGMAVVPQGRIVFDQMTVVENLEMGAYTLKDKRKIPVLMERIFDLFPRLAERKRQAAGTMSGGEQQMLAMGRALDERPEDGADGRAVAGPGADVRGADLRTDRGAEARGADPLAGRAKCGEVALDQRPRLRAGTWAATASPAPAKRCSPISVCGDSISADRRQS